MADSNHIYTGYIPVIYVVWRTKAGKSEMIKLYKEKYPNSVVMEGGGFMTQHTLDNIIEKSPEGIRIIVEWESMEQCERIRSWFRKQPDWCYHNDDTVCDRCMPDDDEPRADIELITSHKISLENAKWIIKDYFDIDEDEEIEIVNLPTLTLYPPYTATWTCSK